MVSSKRRDLDSTLLINKYSSLSISCDSIPGFRNSLNIIFTFENTHDTMNHDIHVEIRGIYLESVHSSQWCPKRWNLGHLAWQMWVRLLSCWPKSSVFLVLFYFVFFI